jgi:hypothetical protein
MFSQAVTGHIQKAHGLIVRYLIKQSLKTMVKTQINDIFRNLEGITQETARSLSISPDTLEFDHVYFKAGSALELEATEEAIRELGFIELRIKNEAIAQRVVVYYLIGTTLSVAIDKPAASAKGSRTKSIQIDHVGFVSNNNGVFQELMQGAIPGKGNVLEKVEQRLPKILYKLPSLACFNLGRVEILGISPVEVFAAPR